jgi:hypothetical protein
MCLDFNKGAVHKFRTLVILVLLSLLFYNSGPAQSIGKDKLSYLSPVPDSRFNPFGTNIIIRFADKNIYNALGNDSFISVTGNKSGKHNGKIVPADDNETLIFKPDADFLAGEIVSVKLYKPGDIADVKSALYEYKFEIQNTDLNKNRKIDISNYIVPVVPGELNKSKNTMNVSSLIELPGLPKEFLPGDFPEIKIYKDSTSTPGVFSFAPFKLDDYSPSYIILVDEFGVPLFYRKTPSTVVDFKNQRTSALTYFDGATGQYYVLDKNYNIIDSLSMRNGYSTDLHELMMLKNGHSLMMSYDYQPYPLDTVFANGRPDAVVIGLIIQELDPNKNVVFQWRSWDHFKLTDVVDSYNTADSVIDYVHGNAIEVDYDGNILISSRHLDEITKIDRQTGEIIWRLGGIHSKNNQFTFINDPIGFSHQHDIRRLPNGHITLFDNGNLHNPPFSRAVGYELDEINKTATLVWEYRNDPDIFAAFMGSARRLDNRNTVIGWGGWMNPPAITEVSMDGNVVMQLSLPDSIINYRAFKFSWDSPYFLSDIDSLLYEYTAVGDSSSAIIQITNNSGKETELNGFFSRDSAFSLITELPVVLQTAETREFEVKFRPLEIKDYNDYIYFRSDSDIEGIALAIPVKASSDSLSTSVEYFPGNISYSLSQNYPNPFNPATTISFSVAKKGLVRLEIYDVLGSRVKTLINREVESGTYNINFNAEEIPSGVYFYSLTINGFSDTKKMLLLK